MPVYLIKPSITSTSLPSFEPHDPIVISGNADFSLQGWPGNGSQQFPYIIEALEIVTDSTCISIASTDAHFIIRNCTLSSQTSGVGTGVYFSNVRNGTAVNCTISSLSIGISQASIEDCNFSNNTIADCSNYGIYLNSGNSCIIDCNQIYGNQGNPIYLRQANYGTIRNNVIYDNSSPLRLYVVNWLEIVNNTITKSSSDGLYLDFTSGVKVLDNRIYGNTGYGLNVRSYALFSEIYNNMIGFNGAGNARDYGIYNEWDDGVDTGNVWSDYSGVGVYSISGMGVDHYPLGFVSRPADVQYVVGASVPAITWDEKPTGSPSISMGGPL